MREGSTERNNVQQRRIESALSHVVVAEPPPMQRSAGRSGRYFTLWWLMDVQRRILTVARPQNGLVTWAQLLQAGLSPAAIRASTARGSLFRVARGVYAVTDPTLLPFAPETAALLSLGAAAVLS